MLGAIALGGCIPSTFVCESSEQCSRGDSGLCEANGVCSYPSDGCTSGRRYSAYGQSNAGECVPEDGETSTSSSSGPDVSTGATSTGGVDASTSSSDASGETGTEPGDCDAACSGHGRCVTVDDAPTCACDPGWWRVGMECLEDPCDSVQCYFVDSDEGDDAGAGTREDPWATQTRAWAYLNDSPSPGDHVLFRRGRTFGGGAAAVYLSSSGTLSQPLVVGAYGPPEEPSPRVRSVTIEVDDAEHWVFRDLHFSGSGGACFVLDRAGHVTVHDNEISECANRAFRISEASHHTVVFRNDIHDVEKTTLFIADITWDPPQSIGEHHWVAANTIRDSEELGIQAGLGRGAKGRAGDFKIVGNQLHRTGKPGIAMNGGAGWILGNVIAEPGPGSGFAAESIGGEHVWLEGNALVSGSEGFRLQDTVTARRNTVRLAESPGGVTFNSAEQVRFTDNVVLSTAGTVVEYLPAEPGFSENDRNVYGTTGALGCSFALDSDPSADLAAWQAFTMAGQESRCEAIPGLNQPTIDIPVDQAFWDALAPEPGWEGCGTTGAVSCEGEPLPVTFTPLPEVETNGGLGWEGPLIIQQHYPLQ